MIKAIHVLDSAQNYQISWLYNVKEIMNEQRKAFYLIKFG